MITFRLGRSRVCAACLCAAAVVAACDDSFEPTAPSDLAFSVFGYLDASADTQWLRVTPIRTVKVTSRDTLAATVTLEHLGTGRIIEFRDSLFSFWSLLDRIHGFDSTYLHNVWTPEDIEPGAAYRFSARREGKEPAEAVVEIPGDYEVEVAIHQVSAADSLRIIGAKHLPFLSVVAHYYDECGSSVTGGLRRRHPDEDETFLIVIWKGRIAGRRDCGRPVVERWEVWMVASEAAWPAGGYSPGALGESGWTSNVTNAVGFLGGVLSKVIPYEDCVFQSQGAPVPSYCRLRYNQETATVIGTVSATSCRVGPIRQATVQLTEVDRDPARIRTVLSNRAGEFLIGALEPGIPHRLWAEAPPIVVGDEPIYVYSPHTDTLTFMPGQQVEYDISLPCSHAARGEP
jgi:hypothetical protein